MKTGTLMISLMTATLILTGCSNNENEIDNGPVAARITAGVYASATRAVGNTWNADHIGVMVTAGNNDMKNRYKNVEYSTATTNSTSADFSPQTAAASIFFENSSDQITFAAYAPYQTSDINALPGTDGVIAKNTRVQTSAPEQEAFDFLYASGATASKGSPTVTFATDHSFHHKMTRLILKLQTSTADGFADTDINNITKIVLGGLKHDGTFKVTDGTTTTTGGVVNDWDIKNNICKTVSKQLIYTMILFPQEIGSTAKLPLTITLSGTDYKNTSDIAPALTSGQSYTYTITIKKSGLSVSGCTIEAWGETDDSGDAVM